MPIRRGTLSMCTSSLNIFREIKILDFLGSDSLVHKDEITAFYLFTIKDLV